MGWGEKIRQALVDGKIQYEIDAGMDGYQAAGLTADSRLNNTIGRVNRVWTARKMSSELLGKNRKPRGYLVLPSTLVVAAENLRMKRNKSQQATTVKRIRFLRSEWYKRHGTVPEASDYQAKDLDLNTTSSPREECIGSTRDDSVFAYDGAPDLSDSLGQAPHNPTVLVHGHAKLPDGSLGCSYQIMQLGKFKQLK